MNPDPQDQKSCILGSFLAYFPREEFLNGDKSQEKESKQMSQVKDLQQRVNDLQERKEHLGRCL